jgi:hypothetical protein
MEDSEIYVSITGGLGNQLFGLAAGIEQATRLGCNLVLLNHNFKHGEGRSFWLSKLDLPEFIKIASAPPRLRIGKKRAVFKERGFNYDAGVLGVRPGTVMEGYFQSPLYFHQTQELISSIVFPSTRSEPLGQLAGREFAAIHVRRGDYLLPETRLFHGLAGRDYFERGLSLLERLHGKQGIVAFSDSPEYVAREFGDLDFAIEFFDPARQTDDLATLRSMGRADRLVMSNSSFSWWAAWHIWKSRDSTQPSRIVAPRPWFAAGDSAMDLLLPSWISLG